MATQRISMVTLGVADLGKSSTFYGQIFDIRPNPDYEGISFFELPGSWLTLYPIDKLAEDISADLAVRRSGFSGVTLALNLPSREAVVAFFERAQAAGGVIVKPPQDTFWGGFSGYFADPDGYHWEVAWGPMFDRTPDGSLCFKA